MELATRPLGSCIWALTEAIGPQRCSSMSKPWHWVSIRLAWRWPLVPGSPPKRHVANEMGPSAPDAIASRAICTGRA